MKLGVIADIHANLPALEAVLTAMPPVDHILCCGDVVGYYADPNEVCELLQQHKVVAVQGNHDAYVLGRLIPDPTRQAAYRTDWTRQTLSAENLQWLEGLPTERRLLLDGKRIILRHASPWDEETYLYPDSPRLAQIELSAAEVLLLGHTHHPLRQDVGGGMVINPGSVGQPRDWNPQAAFATIDTLTRETTFYRTDYAVEVLQRRLAHAGWDCRMIEILSRNKTEGK